MWLGAGLDLVAPRLLATTSVYVIRNRSAKRDELFDKLYEEYAIADASRGGLGPYHKI